MPYDREDTPGAQPLDVSRDDAGKTDEADAAVSVRAVRKRFDRYPALNGVSLDVRPGELLALLGPSGSGKTTLLRTIAGLEFPDEGQVLFEGRDVTFADPAARQVGFVFQQYALFRHMTVAKNIAFGLEVRPRRLRPPRREIAAKVETLLNLVELPGLAKRYPSELSGGQRQRVALARALAVSPRVLLLDEPFGALDATVRKSLRKELRRIHEAAGIATVFVTHDQEEALEIADRVAVLNAGRIEQIGAPDALRAAPETAFVAGFVGEANRIEGEVQGGVFRAGDLTLPAEGIAAGAAVAFVRPEEIGVEAGGAPVRIVRAAPSGPFLRIEAAHLGQPLEILTPRTEGAELSPGETVAVRLRRGRVFAASR